jgi:hypothetical protein
VVAVAPTRIDWDCRASAPARERTPRSAADGAAPRVWSGADGRRAWPPARAATARAPSRRDASAGREDHEQRQRSPRARAWESGGRGVDARLLARLDLSASSARNQRGGDTERGEDGAAFSKPRQRGRTALAPDRRDFGGRGRRRRYEQIRLRAYSIRTLKTR